MKCRYNHCKLGGDVEKDVAVKRGSMYYHNECYKKLIYKEEIRDILKARKMIQRDINIALKKAIDDDTYNVEYVRYVALNRQKEITDPYKLLYQLKIDRNYEEYLKKNGLKEQLKVNQFVKTYKLDNNEIKFNINTSSNKRLNIY